MQVGIFCSGIGYGSRMSTAAKAAENADFSSFWVGEHVVLFESYPESTYPYRTEQNTEVPMPNPKSLSCDPLISMTWAAAATTKIEVASGIVILPQRNPVLFAKELATLDHFCGGRVLLGVGVGWCKEEYRALGADWAGRGKRMDEFLGAMRALWNEPASTFHGETVQFDGAYCYPKPPRNSDMPIMIGGESEAAMKRVARFGDGWLPVGLKLEHAQQKIAHVHQLTKDQGRDPSKLRIIKTITSRDSLDDLKRFRDAGVTEFCLAVFGELPRDEDGIAAGIEKFGERFVKPISTL